MADTPPVQADDADTPDRAKAEQSQFSGGENGGGKPADDVDGNLSVSEKELEEADAVDVSVPPEEDPMMGV